MHDFFRILEIVLQPLQYQPPSKVLDPVLPVLGQHPRQLRGRCIGSPFETIGNRGLWPSSSSCRRFHSPARDQRRRKFLALHPIAQLPPAPSPGLVLAQQPRKQGPPFPGQCLGNFYALCCQREIDRSLIQTLERPATGQQLQNHHAHTPPIAGLGDHSALRLRRAVGHRAARTRLVQRQLRQTGNSKIGQYQIQWRERAHQDIRGLDVPVDDIVPMQFLHRLAQFLEHLPHLAFGNSHPHPLPEVAMLYELHHLISPFLKHPRLQNFHHASAVEFLDRCHQVGLRRDPIPEPLERHLPTLPHSFKQIGLPGTHRKPLDRSNPRDFQNRHAARSAPAPRSGPRGVLDYRLPGSVLAGFQNRHPGINLGAVRCITGCGGLFTQRREQGFARPHRHPQPDQVLLFKVPKQLKRDLLLRKER